MKKLAYLFIILSFSLFATSCDGLFNPDEGPNELSGNVNIPISEENNTFWSSITIGDKYIDLQEDCYVKKNDNGIVTIKIKANIKDYPELREFIDMIPANIADNNGNIETEFKMKMTSEGIQDYFNKDGKAHTIVKYDCKVGDKYELKKSDGTTITRTVTAKSTENDFQYGLMSIKTITIEQDSRIPGVKKIVMKANHKFGLVHVEFQMEDGTTAKTNVFTNNY
jgi:hypothetical protein